MPLTSYMYIMNTFKIYHCSLKTPTILNNILNFLVVAIPVRTEALVVLLDHVLECRPLVNLRYDALLGGRLVILYKRPQLVQAVLHLLKLPVEQQQENLHCDAKISFNLILVTMCQVHKNPFFN